MPLADPLRHLHSHAYTRPHMHIIHDNNILQDSFCISLYIYTQCFILWKFHVHLCLTAITPPSLTPSPFPLGLFFFLTSPSYSHFFYFHKPLDFIKVVWMSMNLVEARTCSSPVSLAPLPSHLPQTLVMTLPPWLTWQSSQSALLCLASFT